MGMGLVIEGNATPVSSPPPLPDSGRMSVGGLVPVKTNAEMLKEEKAAAQARQNRPEIQGLAGHVRKCWVAARDNKEQYIEPRLLAALRQRNGEYDPDKLQRIKAQGGTEIYMMLSSTKARAAASWLRDTLLGTGSEKPWTLQPTRLPDIPTNKQAEIIQRVQAEIQQFMMTTGAQPSDESVKQLMVDMKDNILAQEREASLSMVARMEAKMEDQMQEGGFLTAFNAFIDDLVTYPCAFMKGPIVRKRKAMSWAPGGRTGYKLEVKDDLKPEWDRVDPFNIYPAPSANGIEDGYLIERHRLTRRELNALKGVDGYDKQAIIDVLDEYGKGGLREWLQSDSERAELEGKGDLYTRQDPERTIDALEYHGSVMGQMLIDWGMDEKSIPDPTDEYDVCVWLIGDKVIKAQMNYDPLGRKPYFKASYEELPGQFWGNSVMDLVKDTQDVCNAAARAIVNNMGISSGPQVMVNVDRLPDGANITEMYPWKIWQITDSQMGDTSKPMDFFVPPTVAAELMQIYEKFSTLADEYSGIPRYMTGASDAAGAGRTASGMSMMMGNASKIIKQVVMIIDIQIFKPALERLYFFNMKFSEDPELKGDVNIVARGAVSILQKEQAQVRRNEFLQLVLNSPMVNQLAGPMGVAELLRQVAKTLDLPNVDKVIPSPETLKRQQQMQQAIQMQQQQLMLQQQAMQAQQPTERIEARYDQNGQFIGADVMPGNQQQLQNGAPVTDTFAPMKGA